MYQEFLKIRDQEDPFRYKYMSDPPDAVAYTDAQVSEKTLTLKHVAAWVERWKRHLGRLTSSRAVADLPPTPYFIFVAKPLLPIKTTGSTSVERAANPLKTKLQTRRATITRKISVRCCCGVD
jgi:hypothetical protein